MEQIITAHLAPNATSAQIALAKELLRGDSKQWQEGATIGELESAFEQRFKSDAVAFGSGRAALQAALLALGIGIGDEVIIQAYTCLTVPAAVIATGARPIYADIDPATFNLTAREILKVISPKTKAIVIQHTFGRPAELSEIINLAKNQRVPIIEDCAHSLGAHYLGKPVGTFGDIAIFSFGRDKIISSTHGGMAITRHLEYAKFLRDYVQKLPYPPLRFIRAALHHPIVFDRIKRHYRFGIGHLLAKYYRLTHQVPPVLTRDEKERPGTISFNYRPSAALAQLALNQFARLDSDLRVRRNHASSYYQSLNALPDFLLPSPDNETNQSSWLKYTVRVRERERLIDFAQRQKIWLGPTRAIWYSAPVAPLGTNYQEFGYIQGSCPLAEAAARQSLNLPITHLLASDQVKHVVDTIKSFYERI